MGFLAFLSKVVLLFSAGVIGSIALPAEGTKGVVRGWLSDEDCARNRAATGTYTATGLTCAKACVAQGKKIVLIDPEGKRVLLILNQVSVKKNLGDYVELTGEIDPQLKTLHVASLKFLGKHGAMCGVPAPAPKQE